ncbi:MAG: bacillithiol biosynthesis cysteine-adding enzyme BshC [Acidobacteriota bacterium]
MTANASSSSLAKAPDDPRVDLAANGLLPPLPAAFITGRDRDLLEPLRFLAPGEPLPPRPEAGRPLVDRAAVAEALRISNRAFGNPRADLLADRLADPATRVVVTGQQPGLFGGPLYTLSKAVAAARWATALEERGEPAVPVFWVATEDHDFREVAATTLLGRKETERLDLGDDPLPLTPVGMRTFGSPLAGVLERTAEVLGGDRWTGWFEEVARWYRPDARFGEAFCRLMSRLLGDHSPLFLDAMQPELKRLQQPWLERLVRERQAVGEAIAAAEAAIEERGYPLQVTPQKDVSPLFLLHEGERRRIEWRGDGYRLRGSGDAGGSIDDLLEILADNPTVVSPGVLARPAIQDVLLGSDLQLLGPGEMSYMPQAAAVYRAIGVAAPWTTLRPQALVIESHQLEHLEGLNVSLAELLGDRSRLDHRLAGGSAADPTVEPRQRVKEILDDLEGEALKVDRNLERPLEKTRQQILRALDRLSEKTMAAAARSDQVRLQRVERLRDTLLPAGALQERVVSTAHYPGKYGDRFVESYWRQMTLDGGILQVITP